MAHNGSAFHRLESALPPETAEMLHVAEDAARAASETARKMVANMAKVGSDVGDGLRRSVRDEPVKTILGALAVGFLVGVLWKS